MNKALFAISSAFTGALAMYYLDPDRGKARRGRARDKVTSTATSLGNAAKTLPDGIVNRARGAAAEMRERLRQEDLPDDETLMQRIRSRFSRVVSTPGAIGVTVRQGRVTLEGQILRDNLKAAMSAVWSARGVKDVENRLQVYDEPGNIPALHGAGQQENSALL